MFDPVVHACNPDGEVAVFIKMLPEQPSGWRREGERGIWLMMPGVVDRSMSLSEQGMQGAIEQERLLVVEVGKEGNRETWVSLLD